MSEKATGWTSALRCACVAGQSAAACALSTASSAFACAGVTLGFIRAQIVIPMPARGFTVASSILSGCHASKTDGNLNAAGITPTTAVGTSLTSTCAPSRPGSAANRSRQIRSPITRTGGAAALASASVSVRPRIGATRVIANVEAVTSAIEMGSTMPSPMRMLRARRRPAARSPSVPVPPRQRRKSATTRDSGVLAD